MYATFWKMQNCKGRKQVKWLPGSEDQKILTTKRHRVLSEVMEMFCLHVGYTTEGEFNYM